MSAIIAPLRATVRAVTPVSARRWAQPAANWCRLAWLTREAAAGDRRLRPGPLIVSGFFDDVRGVGQAARLTRAALEAAGGAPIVEDARAALRPAASTLATATAPGGGVWLMHCNPPEMIGLMRRAPAGRWRDRYRIGYWVYEVMAVPALWRRAARLVDEVWTPSHFAAEALGDCGRPVRVMPHPVGLAEPPEAQDAAVARPDPARFTVLCAGDLHSSTTRKNLEGAITAYRQAFGPDEGAELIVKLLRSDEDAASAARVAAAIGGRADIRLITEELPRPAMMALLARSDVFLSLHRGEGFGLVLAEALLAGATPLATGWSGNLEFMAGLEPLLIRAELTPVTDAARIYRTGARTLWAAPDIADAAAKLRWIRANPRAAGELVARGRAQVLGLRDAWTRAAVERLPMAAYVSALAGAPAAATAQVDV